MIRHSLLLLECFHCVMDGKKSCHSKSRIRIEQANIVPNSGNSLGFPCKHMQLAAGNVTCALNDFWSSNIPQVAQAAVRVGFIDMVDHDFISIRKWAMKCVHDKTMCKAGGSSTPGVLWAAFIALPLAFRNRIDALTMNSRLKEDTKYPSCWFGIARADHLGRI